LRAVGKISGPVYAIVPGDGGASTCTSSRDEKQEFRSIDTIELLDRLARLPITAWRFRGEASDSQHLGPTAQNFRAAFGLLEATVTEQAKENALVRAELADLRALKEEVARIRTAQSAR
jgi:hypothetical protein